MHIISTLSIYIQMAITCLGTSIQRKSKLYTFSIQRNWNRLKTYSLTITWKRVNWKLPISEITHIYSCLSSFSLKCEPHPSLEWRRWFKQIDFLFNKKIYKLFHLLVKFYQLNNKVFKFQQKSTPAFFIVVPCKLGQMKKFLSRNKFVIVICLKQKAGCHICKMIWFVKHLKTNRITSDS